jgi:ferredoxin-NADP reductase
MAGTAVHGRLSWHNATVVERRQETETASTLVLDVTDWPGHKAGQHVDVRLRAADGYSAVRTYSIASAPGAALVELTIEQLEILGPIGGWFVWEPTQTDPVQLVAGGSGIVPIMAMIRTRKRTGGDVPFRLIYSVRTPQAVIYANELERLAAANGGPAVTFAYTRATPPDWPFTPKRVDAALVASAVLPAEQKPIAYICGPTSFVEAASGLLTQAGYEPSRIKTERFGPTG